MRETGVGIQDPLFFIGVVENNVDERLEGRVQVRAFGVHGTNDQVPTESLPWATLIHGSYDPDAPLPPVNSFVFGFFVDGRDAQQPMILGLIPTQHLEPIDPETTGWGVIPERDADLLARGSRPTDIGQPRNSREARGEGIEYVIQQEANRKKNIPVASIDPDNEDQRQEFSEPAPAYNTEYPFNRVIRSGRNTIELDDTPGAERVTIYHQKSGSYISIDVNGTSVYRSMSDTYNVNERNYNVYVGGQSVVTVEGDSRVLVKGNKIEEITGDLIQNVRGNHLLSVGGQSNINAGEDIQMRGAKIRIEANVENLNMKASKGINIESKQSTHIKSGIAIFQDAKNSINIKAGDNLFTEIGGTANIKSDSMFLTSTGALDLKGGHVKAGGGSKVSINAQIVAIDDVIQLSSGQSLTPSGASDATAADPAEGTEMPEPVSRGVSVTAGASTPSLGSAGYASTDDAPESVTGESGSGDVPPLVGPSPPTGRSLSSEEEEAVWAQLEAQERDRRIAAGLPEKFSESERNTLKAIMFAEGGDQAANLAVVLNRSYQSLSPVDVVVMANSQFTPATSYLQGYRDRGVGGVDTSGFGRFVGAYTSPANAGFAEAVSRYQSIPQYDKINYFVGAGLPVQYGSIAYTAGNKYSVGPGGRYFAAGGAANLDTLNRYLTENGLA